MELKIKEYDDSISGFRLNFIEVYNWGLFHGNVQRINPNSKSSILLGENGAGKTTLVDAIQTILVPNKLRAYNQSSGAENKKDRNEITYIQGKYGEIKNNETDNSITEQFLRTEKGEIYSVLLASFSNLDKKEIYTLIQILWFGKNGIKKLYIVSNKELTIDNDIRPFNNDAKWRRDFQKEYEKNLVLFELDNSGKYFHLIQKIFGLRSEKALSLFSKTIGIKVLGSLDEFIKNEMIEDYNTEEEFRELHKHYLSLLSIHKSIQKAKKQILLLKPIFEENNELEKINTELNKVLLIEENIELYFQKIKLAKLIENSELINKEIVKIKIEVNNIIERINKFKLKEKELETMINSDEQGKLIINIDSRIESLKIEQKKVHFKHQSYIELCDLVGININNLNEEKFIINNNKIKQEIVLVNSEYEKKKEEWADKRNEVENLSTNIKDISEELSSLENRKNKIDYNLIKVRHKIITELGLKELEIPFVGELIKVKDSEKDWEKAIEIALRSFALKLIVPEKHYSKVNKYIKTTFLNEKISYYKVNDNFITNIEEHDKTKFLINKVEIKDDTQYFNWIKYNISRYYNYICTENLEEFEKEDKAITKEGLLRDYNKHQKDDRKNLFDKSKFILGWNNEDLLKIKKNELEFIRNQQKLLKSEEIDFKNQLLALENKKETLNDLIKYDNYEIVDFNSILIEISNLEKNKLKVQKNNSKIDDFQNQLEKTKEKIEINDKNRIDKLSKQKNFEDNLNLINEKIESIKIIVENSKLNFDIEKLIEEFLEINILNWNLNNFESNQRFEEKKIQHLKEKLREEIDNKSKKILELMSEYRNPKDQKIHEDFPEWIGENSFLSIKVDYLYEYIDKYKKIECEELPDAEEQFERIFEESIIFKMADFQEELEKRRKKIIESIRELNLSLEKIDFTSFPQTYIKINEETTNNEYIKKFREELRDWKPNAGGLSRGYNKDAYEESFNKIKMLINKLSTNDNYRKFVMNVKNWFTFSVNEYCRDDNYLRRVYQSTSELSGGEKAQLTYAILGASLSYQFNIEKGIKSQNSFRFVIVDEAFSKLDNIKSKYLMELIKKLHLQVLIVTPNEKMHVAQDYVQNVHYINKNDNISTIMNMPYIEFDKLINKNENL